MNAHWTSAPLRTVLERVERPESVDPSRTYRLLGVKLYCQGARLQDTVAGDSLKTPKLFRVEEGDITYNKMWVTKGAYAVLRAEHHGAHATSEYPTFRPRASGLDRDFFEYVMQTEAFQAVAASRCSGSTSRARLHPEEFLDVEIPLPPLAEQKKIAAILSSVDEAIRANEAVIEQTRRVKEGLLQELLTRGIGHTEFRETEIGPLPVGWRVARLQEVVRTTAGGPFGSNLTAKDYRETGVPVIRASNIQLVGYVNDGYAYVSTEKRLELDGNVCRPGDILMTQRGAGSTGRVGRIPLDTGYDEFVLSQTMMSISPNESIVRAGFMLAYLASDHFQRWLFGQRIGTGQPHLNLSILRGLPVVVPPVHEQARIEDLAASFDTSIERSITTVERLSTLKSGLLQDLLTGKVRVTP